MKRFRITDDLLGRLASGPVEAETVSCLRTSQLSKHKQLAAYIATNVVDSPLDLTTAVHVLSELQVRCPGIADDLLGAPYFGAWASRMARRLLRSVQSPLPMQVEVSYLNATAAAGAVRGGVDAELTLYVRDGAVLLPTLGSARVDAPELSEVQAKCGGGRLELRVDERRWLLPADLQRETDAWSPVRIIRATSAGRTLVLAVEDLDQYRDCYGKKVAARLTDEEYRRFGDLVEAAWELLVRHVPDRTAELACGLRSAVPLSPVDAGPGLSATSGTAFGGLALTIPEAPEHLAATFVHEFQHSKLSALLDLIPLYDKAAEERYFAAWKPEPRPIGGLLQGAYAFMAVSDFWLRLYEAAGCGSLAEQHFAELRLQVDDVLTTLEECGHLNQDGMSFVKHMRVVVNRLCAVPVNPRVEEAAKCGLREKREAWIVHNADPPISW